MNIRSCLKVLALLSLISRFASFDLFFINLGCSIEESLAKYFEKVRLGFKTHTMVLRHISKAMQGVEMLLGYTEACNRDVPHLKVMNFVFQEKLK